MPSRHAKPANTEPSKYCGQRDGRLPLVSFRLSLLASRITLPFTKKPITLSTVASNMICTATDPASGFTNCGNNASTNSATFGLSRFVNNPCLKILPTG
jgi:hypothetical protein